MLLLSFEAAALKKFKNRIESYNKNADPKTDI